MGSAEEKNRPGERAVGKGAHPPKSEHANDDLSKKTDFPQPLTPRSDIYPFDGVKLIVLFKLGSFFLIELDCDNFQKNVSFPYICSVLRKLGKQLNSHKKQYVQDFD